MLACLSSFQSCLLLVGKHVWVGSFSRNIHILDADTICRKSTHPLTYRPSPHLTSTATLLPFPPLPSDVSQLSYLEDAPRDLALSQTEPK